MRTGSLTRKFGFLNPALIAALIAASGFVAPRAEAVIYYFEFGGGLGKISDVKGLYPDATSDSTSSAVSVPMTFGVNLQARQYGPLFQLGLQARYVSGSAGSSVTVLNTSPIFRIELWRLMLGAGYSPWVWQSASFKKLQATSITYEGAFLFPITPEIDFGLQAAMQTVKPKGGGTEATTLEYGAFFRLNFGLTNAQSKERRKYKGWRYPFGTPLQ